MKKRPFLAAILCICISTLYAQDQQDYEKKNYYELQSPAQFYEVNNRHELQYDTLFLTDPGFLIDPVWREDSIDGKPYVIVTYPKYKQGHQSATEPKVNLSSGQRTVYFPIVGLDGKLLAIPKEDFDKLVKEPIYSVNFLKFKNFKITTGQLTLPFKLRPKTLDKKFQMTTDVTLGAYGGFRKRISRTSPAYINFPVVLGLSFININENTTTSTGTADLKSGILPGLLFRPALYSRLTN